MIKKIIVSLCSLVLVSASTFADNCSFTDEGACQSSTCDYQFKYVKLGAGVFTGSNCLAGPTDCVGYRFLENNHAIDVSANYASSGHSFLVTLPKAVYLHYFTPELAKSFYAGGGLSFGWMHQNQKKFAGLMAEFVVGYDFNRVGNIKMFTELSLTQGLLKVSRKNSYQTPVATITCGIGF